MSGGALIPSGSGHEEWRSVLGWDGIYSVSSLGRVRRECGPTKGTILKPQHTRDGYPFIWLIHAASSRRRQRTVHWLVAEAFIGPRPQGRQVNHKNGDKADNSVGNLEYVTPSENVRHSLRTGLRRPATGDSNGSRRHPQSVPRGSRNGNSKLTEEQAREIKFGSESIAILAQRFGVSRCQAYFIRAGRVWAHLAPWTEPTT